VALGAFAIPRLRAPLLKAGLGLSDWASESSSGLNIWPPPSMIPSSLLSRSSESNGYDVDDPGVIFENWTLTVSGAVQKPGEYTLSQIQALPRMRQNTRHVCVEAGT